MRGDKPPLPQDAFMGWCSVKAQGQLYLTYTHKFVLVLNDVPQYYAMKTYWGVEV